MANKGRKIKVDIVKKDFEKFPFNEEFKGLKIKKIRCLTPKERDDNFRSLNIPIMIELENGGRIQAFTGGLTLTICYEYNKTTGKYEKIYKESPKERDWQFEMETRTLKS